MAVSLKDLVKSLGLKGVRPQGEDDLALDAEAFARHATTIFAQRPLRVLRLWKATGDDLAAALARPELARVEELFLFRNRLTDADLELLFSCPNLGAVRALDFKWCGLNARQAARIADADPAVLPALRVLSLFGNRIGAKGVTALASSALVGQLTALDLDANHGGDEALAALLGSDRIKNLETLAIDRNEAGALALAALERTLPGLRLVELSGFAKAAPLLERNRQRRASRPYAPPVLATLPKASPAPKAAAGDEAQGRRLLAQLLDDPSSAERRAVWSDWLQQRADPRGEHLALEAAYAHSPTPELEKRLTRARATTLKALQQKHKHNPAQFELGGGLVTLVRAQLSWFLERGQLLLDSEPLRTLVLEVASADGLPKLATLRGIERLEWLIFTKPSTKLFKRIPWAVLPKVAIGLEGFGFFRYEPLSAYLELPHFERVKALAFHTSPTGEELSQLATDPRLAQLERLDLGKRISAATARKALEQSRWQLTSLRLPGVTSALRRELGTRFEGARIQSDGDE